MNDPLVQTYIVGTTLNLAGAAIAFYLWTAHRGERFLLFWACAWTAGAIRWGIHSAAEFSPMLRAIEGLMIPVTMFFVVLGSYDLLPARPWRHAYVVVPTAIILLAFGVAASLLRLPLELGYALFAAVAAFSGACMWVSYRRTRLPGYALAAATFLYQFGFIVFGLSVLGRSIANSIVGPLYNIPLMLSIILIAYQREKRKVIGSERALQQIFETAPTPLIITRPPGGEIERANAAAFDMAGISPETAIGRTLVEQGIVPDSPARQAIHALLLSGQRVIGQELVMFKGGKEKRTVSINADRIALEGGDRYIFSFYDLTELRCAEEQLRASAEEMRQLYVRLAKVEDEERRALHAELHDKVASNLPALRLELDVAASLFARGETSHAQRHLDTAREVVTETIAVARDLMADLRPPALDDYGLVAALRTLAESQAMRLDLLIQVEGNDLAPRPSPLVEDSLFRIAQEALINAARHASGKQVTVAVGDRAGRVILTVEDDGIGFSLEAVGDIPNHWGLKNMRERAHAIGGTLRVDTAPGAGTRVIVEAPREAA